MKSRPKRRYKKRKHDLILYLKIALICYLTIFGVGYISSDTSAYLSSKSEFSNTMTAGIWEVPEVLVNACGEEYTIDGLSNERADLNDEIKVDSSIEGSESEIDCGEQDGPSVGSCIENGENVAGENKDDVVSSEGDLTDCMNKGEDNDNAAEDVEIPSIDQENGDQNELEDGDIKSEKDDEDKAELDDSKVDEGQKPNDETQKQPDSNGETVTESEDINQTDQDSPTAETLESSNE